MSKAPYREDGFSQDAPLTYQQIDTLNGVYMMERLKDAYPVIAYVSGKGWVVGFRKHGQAIEFAGAGSLERCLAVLVPQAVVRYEAMDE